MDATTQTRLARRYPPPAGRRWWPLVPVSAALIGGVWLGWTAWAGAHPEVSARIDAFEVRSTTETQVRLTIERADPAHTVRCLLYGQAVSFERVGERQIEVAPGETITSHTVVLRTFKEATTVDIEGCRRIG